MGNAQHKILIFLPLIFQLVAIFEVFYYAGKAECLFSSEYSRLPGITIFIIKTKFYIFIFPALTAIWAIISFNSHDIKPHLDRIVYVSFILIFIILSLGLVGIGQLLQ